MDDLPSPARFGPPRMHSPAAKCFHGGDCSGRYKAKNSSWCTMSRGDLHTPITLRCFAAPRRHAVAQLCGKEIRDVLGILLSSRERKFAATSSSANGRKLMVYGTAYGHNRPVSVAARFPLKRTFACFFVNLPGLRVSATIRVTNGLVPLCILGDRNSLAKSGLDSLTTCATRAVALWALTLSRQEHIGIWVLSDTEMGENTPTPASNCRRTAVRNLAAIRVSCCGATKPLHRRFHRADPRLPCGR